MSKFNQGGDFSGRDRSFDRNAPRQMYQAVCAECGQKCEVPFKPSGDRPVLCSACFKQSGRGGDREDNRREERRDERPRNENRKMYDTTCAKCGKPCQVPFQPKPGRDIFCSDCFSRDGKHEAKPSASNQGPKGASYDQQFAALNAKLDKIINYLNPAVIKPAAVKPLEMIVKPTSAKAMADKPEVKKPVSAKVPVAKAEKKIASKKKVSKKK
ncbi:MAG: hypothetical protein PHE24_03535 [Patescibacteria group bacterium]|nr:hypothetical protein [Patescibacteria group bacterium]